MSMEVITIIEFIQTLASYTVCVCLVPYIVFHDFLHEKCLSEKFIASVLIGNFYIINVVFIIFLLKIPGRISLYLFTIVPAFIAWIRINRPGIREFFSLLYHSLSRLFLGEAHLKTILDALFTRPKEILHGCVHAVFSHISKHIYEWILLLGLIAFNIYYYGYQTTTTYIFGSGDLTVHQYWINEMDNGVMFQGGIYPFGFHNIIWFLHGFFGISTVSLLRVFGVVETLFIYMMIYMLLRKICRSRYLPILGVFLFTLPDIFDFQGTMRYQWSLPQEFGMIFLYPCAYFLIQFFERKKDEIQTKKKLAQEERLYAWLIQYHIMPSTKSLAFFAISFSLTLAAHFYITIIAVILCVTIAIAYFPIVFHPKYFWSIALTGIISLSCAIAPLGIAYMQGTRLEGSLKWALSVISPEGDQNSTNTIEETTDADDNPENSDYTKGTDEKGNSGNIEGENTNVTSNSNGSTANSQNNVTKQDSAENKTSILDILKTLPAKIPSLAKRAKEKLILFNSLASVYLNGTYNYNILCFYILGATECLAIFSLLMMLFRRKFYYRNLFAISLYTMFLMVMYSAQALGLPVIMDLARSRIFLAYATPLLIACLVDAVYVILFWPLHYHKITEIAPIGLILVLTCLTLINDFIRPLNIVYSLQLPGEMKCNYKIMDTCPEKRWTVVTTTSSMQTLREKGWHMEVCTFLEKMENYTKYTTVTIPTKYVFFYIEKTPLDYGYDAYNLVTEEMANSGLVSENAAARQAEFGGTSAYYTENRYILESKLYYWAKAFKTKFPKEFQVYYEDESFICYRIIQNEYQLYNFALDYGFNR